MIPNEPLRGGGVVNDGAGPPGTPQLPRNHHDPDEVHPDADQEQRRLVRVEEYGGCGETDKGQQVRQVVGATGEHGRHARPGGPRSRDCRHGAMLAVDGTELDEQGHLGPKACGDQAHERRIRGQLLERVGDTLGEADDREDDLRER